MDGDGFGSVTAGAVMNEAEAIVTIGAMIFSLAAIYIIYRYS